MFSQLIDISRTLYEGMPVYPGDLPFSQNRQLLMGRGDLCNLSNVAMSLHTGTHIDAPLHFIPQGADVSQLPLDLFFGKARVWKLDSREPLGAASLAQLPLVGGDRVLLNLPVNEAADAPGQVGLAIDAAELLIARGVALVGINCASIEYPATGEPYGVHQRLLAAGITVLENLTLAGVESGEYFLACFPLKIAGGDGSPVRAVLLR